MESTSLCQYPSVLLCPARTAEAEKHAYDGPRLLNCGHHVCFPCAIDIILNKQPCPTCKKPVTAFRHDEDFEGVVCYALHMLNLRQSQITEAVQAKEAVRYPFDRGNFHFLKEQISVLWLRIKFYNIQNGHPIEEFVLELCPQNAIACKILFFDRLSASVFKDYLDLIDLEIELFHKLITASGYEPVKMLISLLLQNNDFDQMSSQKIDFVKQKIDIWMKIKKYQKPTFKA